MLKYDKIMIIALPDDIEITNNDAFVCTMKSDKILYYKYKQKKPYSLLIRNDIEKDELVLEFTGKILLDKYPQLISKDTIDECLTNINKMGICKLDIDSIMDYAQVGKVDVTIDVPTDINSITSYVKQNIINNAKWYTKKHQNGIELTYSAITSQLKKRLIIYNKDKEMKMAKNEEFRNALTVKGREDITDYFRGKVRFELNLNSKHQIKTLLNIPDTSLQNVLNSTKNPILSVIEEAVKYNKPQQRYKTMNLNERMRLSFLKECDYDLAKVEAEVRSHSSKNTSITRAMQPFRDLWTRLKGAEMPKIDFQTLLSA